MDESRLASVRFTDRSTAERAMQAALKAGFAKQDVSITTSSDRQHFIVRVQADEADRERALQALRNPGRRPRRGAGGGAASLAQAFSGEGGFPMAGPLLAAFAVGYLVRFARS